MFRKVMIAILFPLWLGSVGYVLWHYQVKHYIFFQKESSLDWSLFKKTLQEELSRSVAGKLPMVLYFRNTDCLCNRYSDRRLEKIVEQFSTIRYILVPAPGQATVLQVDDDGRRMESPFSDEGAERLWKLLPAAPVAAVVSGDFQIAYFGPYEAAAFCGRSGKGFVETTLENLLNGEKLENINLWEKACFCPTRKTKRDTKRSEI